MNNNYICKIANINEMEIKWDEEINKHPDNENWVIWKKENIDRVKDNKALVYHGLLDGNIICEATALIDKTAYVNSDKLIDKDTAYLTGFRTEENHENKGCFSKLYKFMENDLFTKGYKHLTLGVEACEVRNMMIYFKYGFNDYIKSEEEVYPDGKSILVNFYKKNNLNVNNDIKFNRLIPELDVLNLQDSISFYKNIGFEVKYERNENKFAFIEMQGTQFMLQELSGNNKWETGKLEYPFGRGINFQIEVNNVDIIYNNIKKCNYKIFEEINENYYRQDDKLLGNKEFLVQDPNGYLLRICEDLGEK